MGLTREELLEQEKQRQIKERELQLAKESQDLAELKAKLEAKVEKQPAEAKTVIVSAIIGTIEPYEQKTL